MGRLQILQLPEGPNDERPPFAIVIDQADHNSTMICALTNDDTRTNIIRETGARTILIFEDETIDIPANDTTAYLNCASQDAQVADGNVDHPPWFEQVREQVQADLHDALSNVSQGATHARDTYRGVRHRPYAGSSQLDGLKARDKDRELRDANERIERLLAERDDARTWARHGYEIGQRHCGWSDHGVAPAWLTEDWPTSFDSCQHLKQAATYDEALTRVRAEVARIRTTSRTWEPVADLIDAALNNTTPNPEE